MSKIVTLSFEISADDIILSPLENEGILNDLAYRTMREFSRDLAKITGRSAWDISERVLNTFVAEG